MKRFNNITEVSLPEHSEGTSQREVERDTGVAILRSWIDVARWHMADEEVAETLEKEATRIRGMHP